MYLARVKRRRRSDRGSASEADQPIVMVKTLQSRQSHLQTEFAREAELHGLVPGHPAVAALLAHCHEIHPHLMVVEYSDWVSCSTVVDGWRYDLDTITGYGIG